MEGTGSRPGRSTSRYGSAPPSERQPVFNGAVRKWKKQWVSCQSKEGKQKGIPPVLLYKWTAVSGTASSDEPRKRRFRYYPIVSLEKENKGTPEKVSSEAEESNKNVSSASSEMSRAVGGVFEDLYDVDVSFQKPSEDEYNLNKSPVDSSYTGGNGGNNFFGSKRMMINWEDELKSN